MKEYGCPINCPDRRVGCQKDCEIHAALVERKAQIREAAKKFVEENRIYYGGRKP